MEQKTFEQIHSEVKLEHGITGLEAINKFRITLPIATERYANHCAEIAFNAGCKAQHYYELENKGNSNYSGFLNGLMGTFEKPVNPYANP